GDTLELITRVPTRRQPGDGVFPSDIHSSPDGRRAYVANRGAVNTIATFDTTRPGRPELIGEASCGGMWPRHFAVTPDRRFHVVVAEAAEQLGVLVGQRLRHRDVQQQRTGPVPQSPGVGVEAGELLGQLGLELLADRPDVAALAAPVVGPEAVLFRDELVEPL